MVESQEAEEAKASISFWVPGPVPGKPRMTRRDKWARRPCVWAYRAWCDKVRMRLLELGLKVPPADTVTTLSWEALFKPPKSWSQTKRQTVIGELHRSKPDRDNIDKAVLDCLYSESDSAIAMGTIAKRWGPEDGILVSIEAEQG